MDWHAIGTRLRDVWLRPPTGPAVDWALVAAIVLGAFAFELVRSAVDEDFRLALNLIVGGLLLIAAARLGLGASDLALERNRLRSGLIWGGAGVLVVGLILFGFGAINPEGLIGNEDYRKVGSGEAAFKVLVRIPFGTALFEEIVFRAVLLGLLLRNLKPFYAALASSVMFGLWHIVPNVERMLDPEIIARDVGFTFLVGLVFAWLVLHTRSLLAPTLLHWGANAWGYGIGWLIVENNWFGVT